MINQKEKHCYLNKVKKCCAQPFRKRLIVELENAVSEYIDENPNSSIEDLIRHFGVPEKFAEEYIMAMDNVDRKNIIRKVKWIKRTIFIGIAVVVLIVAATAAWIIYDDSTTDGYYYQEYVIDEEQC